MIGKGAGDRAAERARMWASAVALLIVGCAEQIDRGAVEDVARTGDREQPAPEPDKTPRVVRQALARLSSGDLRQRTRAIRTLGEQPHPAAIDGLLERLASDPDSNLRYAAARALAAHGPEVVPGLLELLRTARDGHSLLAVLESLGLIGDARACEPVGRAALHDPGPDVRARALDTLGELGCPTSVNLALRVINKEASRLVTERAEDLLVRLGRVALPDLVTALKAGLPLDRQIRLVSVVERIGDAGASPALVEHLASIDDPGLGAAIIRALGRLGDPGANPLLLEILQHEPDAGLRQDAAHALAMIGEPEVFGHLVGLLDHVDPVIRSAGAEALGKLRLPDAIPVLEEAYGRESVRFVQVGIIFSLGMLNHPDAVQVMDELLEVESADGRDHICMALARTSVPESVLTLLRVMGQDPDPGVRTSAMSALGLIGAIEALPVLEWAAAHEDHYLPAMAAVKARELIVESSER